MRLSQEPLASQRHNLSGSTILSGGQRLSQATFDKPKSATATSLHSRCRPNDEQSGLKDDLIVWYGSSYAICDDQVKTNILEILQRLKITRGQETSNRSQPQIIQFKDHPPYMLTVSIDAIRDRFFDRFNMLQAKKIPIGQELPGKRTIRPLTGTLQNIRSYPQSLLPCNNRLYQTNRATRILGSKMHSNRWQPD